MQEKVQLDTTLAELYVLGKEDRGFERLAIALYAAGPEVAPMSQNSKYFDQDGTFGTTLDSISSRKDHEIQQATTIQYDAFAAGDNPVVVFGLDNIHDKERSVEEAEKTLSSLSTSQRPQLVFIKGPKYFKLGDYEIDLLATKKELDELEGFPVAVNLDMHYFLNSKAALANSGLPTPKTILLELDDHAVDPGSCCVKCRLQESISSTIPSACSGTRFPWLMNKIGRLLEILGQQKFPFVIKNQQTSSGSGGSFVVANSEQYEELRSALISPILPKLLSQVNATNAHLKPATLILSEMINDPIGHWGLSFFVTRNGECFFLAVTQQTLDSSKAWTGSRVVYPAQDDLKVKFTPLMTEIGAWLWGYGYYGPCSADILETALSPSRNGFSRLNIIDLNLRISGSLVLGLMKGHFFDRRGLHEASSFPISVKLSREEFIEKYMSDFQDGSMVIGSWYEDEESSISHGSTFVGARCKEELEKRGAELKGFGKEVHS